MRSNTTAELSQSFLGEYGTKESVRRYAKETAGYGISYLLRNVYGPLYFDVIKRHIPRSNTNKGLRLWEIGCGTGMNLLYLVSELERQGVTVDGAYGTDFSKPMIDAAKREAKEWLTPKQDAKVRFCTARNEYLIEEVSQRVGVHPRDLLGSFHFILGVNTIRYCHRLHEEHKCVAAICNLLVEGGVCVIIDMNDKFPAFRSRLHDRRTKSPEAIYLPSLEEYARPFVAAGFEILRKDTFSWIPHSAGPRLTTAMRAATPMLNSLARSHAMRSLVIARKHRCSRVESQG